MYSSYTCLYDMFEVSYLSLLLLPPTQLVAHLLFNVCCVRSFNLNYFFKFVLAIFLGLVFGYHMPNHLFVIRVMQMFVVIHTHTHTYLYTDKHSNWKWMLSRYDMKNWHLWNSAITKNNRNEVKSEAAFIVSSCKPYKNDSFLKQFVNCCSDLRCSF